MNAITAFPRSLVTVKPRTFALLRLLRNGEFHSGEMLAQRLGISRASVSNALRGIEHLGLILYSVRGRGYCLSNPPQWLDSVRIEHHLGELAAQFKLQISDSTESTNTQLLQRATQGAPSGSVLAVEWQTGGRGRMGRVWHTGLGNALTYSVLWRFGQGVSALSGFSLVTGIALVRVLRASGFATAQLKWPNDVLAGNRKLAGILIEAQGDMLGPSAVVTGIGLNVSLPQYLRSQIDQPVTCLTDIAVKQPGTLVPERNALLANLLREMHNTLIQFAGHGFAPFRAEWQSYHAYHNQSVKLMLPDGSSAEGIARGVTDNGALMLETAHGTQICHTGELGAVTP